MSETRDTTTDMTAAAAGERWPRPDTSAVVLAVLGIVLLFVAASAMLLWSTVLAAGAAVVFLSIPVLRLSDHMRRWLVTLVPTREGRRTYRRFKLAMIGAVEAGLIAAWLSVELGWAWLGVLATAMTAVGAVGVFATASLSTRYSRAYRPSFVPRVEPRGELVRDLWFAAELTVGGMLLVWALDRFTAFAWLGLAVWFVGLIVVKQAVASGLARSLLPPGPTLRVSLDIAAVGVLALIGGTASGSQLAVLIGVAGVFVGFSTFGIAAMYFDWFEAHWEQLVGFGVVFVIGGFFWMWNVFGVGELAFLVATFVAIVAAWFVFRGEGIILIVVTGFVMVWGIGAPTSDAAADPNPDADLRILAIGDSFISGEGADEYLAGTNQVGGDRNECRRAATAHPYRIATALEASLTFAACSGATTDDLFTCGQMATGDDRCRELEEWGAPPDGEVVFGDRPQLANFTPAELGSFDVVLLSIGGNDVGFSTIIQACLLPESCNERSVEWFANVDRLGSTLVATYARVRELVPDTPVIVVPYPHLLDERTCGIGVDAAEHRFVIRFIDRLDDTIAAAAAEAGVPVYEGARGVFDGSRLCDPGTPSVNHLALDPPNGSPIARYQPGTWVHNSMHPTPDGHCQLAFEPTDDAPGGLVGVVAEAAGVDPPADADVPECAGPIRDREPRLVEESESAVTDDESSTVEEAVDAATAEDLLSDREWITNELYRTVRSLLLPALLLVVGSLAFAIGFSFSGWRFSDLLRQRTNGR